MRVKKSWMVLAGAALAAGGILILSMGAFSQEPPKTPPKAPPAVQVPMGSAPASFVEILRLSQEQKKGVTFWVKGQTIGGAVVKASGDGTVELRNQEFGRIILRLESVDALAIN